jgi:nucleoside-diphosphate-sugar epimerase
VEKQLGKGKIVVAGATGVIGLAALRLFSADPGWEVIGLSRRVPHLEGVAHCQVDLTSRDDCARQLAAVGGVTHLAYCALQEQDGLIGGWSDLELMEKNLQMFANVLDPLVDGGSLHHVSLLQGGKAYGVHLAEVPVPAKEWLPRHPHPNFYFHQEDYLRSAAQAGRWGWTILRPQVVFGESIGSPMNLIPAIGAYGAVCRAQGRPFCFPGGPAHVLEAADADVVAESLVWAATEPGARNDTFNVTNGDVFVWEYVWPTMAEALGVEVGEPQPASWVADSPQWAETWAGIVDRHHLRAPRRLSDFVGDSFVYADRLFAGSPQRRLPALLSTVKIRRAGFAACIDTEDMFRKWFRRFQQEGLLPPL